MSSDAADRFGPFSRKEREVLAMGLVAVALATMEPTEEPSEDLSPSEKAEFLGEIVPLMTELFPQVKIPDDLMTKLNWIAAFGDELISRKQGRGDNGA